MSEEKSIALATLPRAEDHAIQAVKMLSNIVLALRKDVLKRDVDYGIIPGTGDKETLLLPGMEKLMRALNAVPEYIERCVIRDYAHPLFHYEYECRLIDAETGMAIPGGRGLGLCTSMESSFAWRWVEERLIPPGLDKSTLRKQGGRISEFTFAVDKAETTGKYGKPAEYWQAFKDAIENGTAKAFKKTIKSGELRDAWEIDSTVYRIQNPDIFDQVNAILKRAKKRSLGDAIKGAANVSEFFTVDLEDFARYDDAIEATFSYVNDVEPPKRPPSTVLDQPARPPSGEEAKDFVGNPEQAEDTTPKPWADEATIKWILEYAPTKLDGIVASDISRYTGIADLKEYAAWNAKYPSSTAAMKAIKEGFDTDTIAAADAQPAQPKASRFDKSSAHAWTPDEIGAMDTAAGRFWNVEKAAPMLPKEAVEMLGKLFWTEFGDPKVAIAALRAACIQKEMPIVATKAVYVKNPKAKVKYSELSNGILEVRKLGLGDEMGKLSAEWAAYVESWEQGETYTFNEAEMPDLLVTWTLDDGTPTVNEIKVLELAF